MEKYQAHRCLYHKLVAPYSNLQLGASFPMNSKTYNAFAGGDYLNNCRQMQISSLGGLNGMSRYHPGLYGDMYQPGHPPAYANGGFYPDMGAGLPPLPGRDLNCSSAQSDSPSSGKTIYFSTSPIKLLLAKA
uniref:Uncharacterized protein n=1 Tax=Biomphalaria glabrata TaxID=6526 RepID=A0A2C9L0P9_BIOGL